MLSGSFSVCGCASLCGMHTQCVLVCAPQNKCKSLVVLESIPQCFCLANKITGGCFRATHSETAPHSLICPPPTPSNTHTHAHLTPLHFTMTWLSIRAHWPVRWTFVYWPQHLGRKHTSLCVRSCDSLTVHANRGEACLCAFPPHPSLQQKSVT